MNAWTAVPALAGGDAGPTDPWRRRIGAVTIALADDRSIVTLAPAAAATTSGAGEGDEDRFGDRLREGFGLAVPATGSSESGDAGARLLGVQRDQLWLILPTRGTDPANEVRERLGDDDLAWATDQSDGWSTLELSGEGVFAVLERLCPLDLSAARFPVGAVGRTVTEHLAAIVLRLDESRFELLTPRSSVASFAHAIELVANHVNNERSAREEDAA